jgi:uncharacterized membrane protein
MAHLMDATLQIGQPGIFFILLLTLLALTSVWQILSLRSRVSPGRTAIVAALRFSALGALLFLLLEPTLVRERRVPYRPSLAVAIDTSRSMALQDSEGRSRLESVTSFLGSPSFRIMVEEYYPEYYSFSGKGAAVKSEELPLLKAEGEWTDLHRSVAMIEEEAPSSLGAVVLFSDGGHGLAAGSAERIPTRAGVPLILVGVGGDDLLRDVEVEAVEYAGMAFAGRPVGFVVRVRSRGYGGSALPLLLKDGEKVVLSRNIILPEEGEVLEVEVDWTPQKAGVYNLAFEIPAQGGEQIRANNSVAVTLEVARDKIRMLYVSGRPGWSYRFLRDALKGDPSIDLVTFIILRSAADAVNVPQDELSLIPFPTKKIFLEELDNFDIVVFDDFSYRFYFPVQYLEKLNEFVAGGGAFWMLGGPLSFMKGGYSGSPLAEVLPVTFEGVPAGEGYVPGAFQAAMTPAGRRHPLFKGLGGVDLDQLPLLDGYNSSGAPRAGAVALVTRGGEASQPVMVVGRFGDGRTLAVLTDSLWKWNFEMVGKGEGNLFFLSLIRRAVRWSVGDRLMQPLSLRLESDRLSPGRKVHGTIRVLGDDYLPDVDPDLRVVVGKRDGGSRSLPAVMVSPGLFKVSATVAEAGNYELRVTAMSGGKVRSEDSVSFEVAWPSSEYHDPGLNRAGLEALLAGSPGGIVELRNNGEAGRQLADLLGEVAPPYRIEFSEKMNLGETLGVFLFFLVILGAEWAVRKRFGLD